MTITEDYFGEEVTYKLYDDFIITKEGKRLTLSTIDWGNRICVAGKQKIPFDHILTD